ncbi:hypothetical protein BS47DRAFT_608345 [Hydnum rufescens UP504]|uniref:DUF6534 domain-containing protein n=1 Tax=Hydnum rufescens UP504 TaxID=1448309 RepID=A0A9P6DZB1_9AGAM|nr:hypothetical protein BS47DRAFT_608345 [Hydnum rufescens UP504]
MYTVTHFGDFNFIKTSNWVFNTDPVMTVIISTAVQSFFAWRVKILTGHKWLYIALNISAVIQLLCGMPLDYSFYLARDVFPQPLGFGTTIGCAIVKDFLKFQEFKSVVIVWLSLSALTDVIIALTMVQYLRSHRTGFSSTEDILTKLVRFTIQTGAVTSLWAILDLIIYLSFPNNLHLIFNMPLSKLYSNACISSLNARNVWSGDPKSVDNSVPMTGVTIITSSTVHRDSLELPRTYSGHQLRLGLDSHRLSRSPPAISTEGDAFNPDHHNDYKEAKFVNIEHHGLEKGSPDEKAPSPTLTYMSYEGGFPKKA